MSYDVFLVSALEDRDTAKLVARRLRTLKFKVWLDQKQEDETFDAKDARDAMNSQSMLVLWSASAVKSDWVRAAAAVGNSRSGTLIEAALDKTIPYEPFRTHKRFALDSMTSRKTPPAFADLIDELGRRQGRSDLREWNSFGAQDEDKRLDWLAAHPNDPLALDAKKKREKDLGIKPAPAREAIGAAALAAASLRGVPSAVPPAANVLSPARTNGATPLASNGAIASPDAGGRSPRLRYDAGRRCRHCGHADPRLGVPFAARLDNTGRAARHCQLGNSCRLPGRHSAAFDAACAGAWPDHR